MEIMQEGPGRSSCAGEKKLSSFKLFGAIINVCEEQDEEVPEDCRSSWMMVTSEKNSNIDSISCDRAKGKESVDISSSSDEDADESAKCSRYSNLFKKKRGESWTEEEHKAFLAGLHKFGRGNWKRISTEFVPTRSGTQVASHAQKYFLRMEGRGKANRRSSIFDTQFECLATSSDAAGTRALVPYQACPPTSRIEQARSVCSSYNAARSRAQFPSQVSWPWLQVCPNIPAPYTMGVGLLCSNEQGLGGRVGGGRRMNLMHQLQMQNFGYGDHGSSQRDLINFLEASNPMIPGPSRRGKQHLPIQID